MLKFEDELSVAHLRVAFVQMMTLGYAMQGPRTKLIYSGSRSHHTLDGGDSTVPGCLRETAAERIGVFSVSSGDLLYHRQSGPSVIWLALRHLQR